MISWMMQRQSPRFTPKMTSRFCRAVHGAPASLSTISTRFRRPTRSILASTAIRKMAVIAAAFDPRITAVIAGSTGVGGVLPFRASSETGFGEGIETTTRAFPTWFAPQLRFFVGREDRLPVDGNLIAALIAPRSLLMEWGHNDQVSSTWGNEQTYYSSLKVYKLLGAPNAVATFRLPGFHGANDEEADLDWLDQQFGRQKPDWTNNLILQWNWNQWRTRSGETVDLTKYPKYAGDDILKA